MSIPPIYKYGAVALLVLLLAVAAVVSIGRYGAHRYAAGEQAGRNAVLADDARAAAQLQQQREQLDQFSALATTQLAHTLATDLPAVEASTHDTVETIRTVYRDRPVPVDRCTRPDGVQKQLDTAVARANAAARGQL